MYVQLTQSLVVNVLLQSVWRLPNASKNPMAWLGSCEYVFFTFISESHLLFQRWYCTLYSFSQAQFRICVSLLCFFFCYHVLIVAVVKKKTTMFPLLLALSANEGERWWYPYIFFVYGISFFSRRPTEKVLYMTPEGQENASDVQARCVLFCILMGLSSCYI